MNTYAEDLSELLEMLDLKNAVLIGFSAGGGEVAHYIGRHGNKRVAKVGSITDCSQFYKDFARDHSLVLTGPELKFQRV